MKELGIMKKSENDRLIYNAYQLPNELKVIFVEDPTITKSVAVLHVEIGSIYDPMQYQGLAHFLEHMLFMGSSKYPDPSYYSDFISQKGGELNAWTDLHSTCYYHSIGSEYFIESLDILSQNLINPLFDKNFVDKEMNSIESELWSNDSDEHRIF